MGLDITAYRQLKPVAESHDVDDTCYDAGHFRPWNDAGYMERMSGLLGSQCYTTSEERFKFRAGSYSGYNDWRNQLSLMAQGRPASEVWDDPTGAFSELINFSDCEGTIGPLVAAKLLKDFSAFYAKAEQWLSGDEGEWFIERYQHWMHAFEMAADNGAVSLH